MCIRSAPGVQQDVGGGHNKVQPVLGQAMMALGGTSSTFSWRKFKNEGNVVMHSYRMMTYFIKYSWAAAGILKHLNMIGTKWFIFGVVFKNTGLIFCVF